MRKNKGFTLIEVMICAAILVGLLVGLISIYVYCFDLQETARNTSLALNETRARLEEIKNSNFAAIETNYNVPRAPLGATSVTIINLTSIPTGGIIRIEAGFVTGSSNNLIDLRIVACWRQKGGRIVGEAVFNGTNLVPTDLDGDTIIESPVELVTSIANKGL